MCANSEIEPILYTPNFRGIENEQMTIKSITLPVALRLNTQSFSGLEDFFVNAKIGEYRMFTHQNFFYSFPLNGTKWQSGKDCQFHRVNVMCNICGNTPERTRTGIGTMYLVMGAHGRAVIVCPEHIKGHVQYARNRKSKLVQLSLF